MAYYVITCEIANGKIKEYFKKYNDTAKTRRKFINENFPPKWTSCEQFGTKQFGVRYDGAANPSPLPPQFRFNKNCAVVPNQKTKEGRKIAKAINDLPELPLMDDITTAIGLARFQFIDGSVCVLSPGVSEINKGKYKGSYLVKTDDEWNYKCKCGIRIADTEAEKLTQKPRKTARKGGVK